MAPYALQVDRRHCAAALAANDEATGHDLGVAGVGACNPCGDTYDGRLGVNLDYR